jgi:hypothetical protein
MIIVAAGDQERRGEQSDRQVAQSDGHAHFYPAGATKDQWCGSGPRWCFAQPLLDFTA